MARKSIAEIKARRHCGSFPARRGGAGRRFAVTGLAAVAAGLLTACASAGTGQTTSTGHQSAGSPGVVFARSLPGIGTVLVNRSGNTIYSPQQEARGKILCTAGCLNFWLPVPVAPGTALRGSSGITGVLGTIHRADDGLTQLTYDGKPLYTFRLDQAPGQVHGNNFTDHFGGATFTWHAITTAGTPVGPAQPTAPASYSYQGGSSGY